MKLTSFVRTTLAIAAACAALGTAPAANSSTLIVTNYNFRPPLVSFDLFLDGNPVQGTNPHYAGEFTGTLDLNDIRFYCAELTQGFVWNTPINVTVGPEPNALLEQLFGLAFPSVNTAAEAAALQLAIWDIIYDTDRNVSLSNGGNPGNGFLAAPQSNADAGSGVAATAAIAQANAWLGALANYNGPSILLDHLYTDAYQDFITPRPHRDVPEPAPVLLLAIGLLGVIVFARRKSRKQAA